MRAECHGPVRRPTYSPQQHATEETIERVCMNPFVERGALEMALPEWAFVPHSHQQSCGPTENADVILVEMGLNPFDTVEHEQGPDLGQGEVVLAVAGQE